MPHGILPRFHRDLVKSRRITWRHFHRGIGRQPDGPSEAASHCARQPVKRRRTVRFDLSDEEYRELSAAADRAGLARSAFAAQAALLAARR